MSNGVNSIINNTSFLYLRMLIVMAIMLYTSRVLLDVLGASGYGLYHVLVGVVLLLGFLQEALSATTQRFIAVELGRADDVQLPTIFSMSVIIHVMFATLVALAAFVVGYLWLTDFIDYGDNAPETVRWAFTFIVATFIVNLLALPCHAAIISYERMRAYAWLGMTEAFLKLAAALALPWIPAHALLAYAVLLFIAALLMTSLAYLYVGRKLTQLCFQWRWHGYWLKTLASFSGWTLWGNLASVLANQGITLLINIFFGPVLNAAKAIGNQASGAINQFVTNLQSAMNPQLIKSYSAKDINFTDKLIYYGAKYNFFLIIFLALPVLTYTEEILALWLVEVPPYASLFLKILITIGIVESLSRPLVTAASATGNIKLYQLVVSGVRLLNLPLSYIALQQGAGPEWVFYIALIVTVVASFARIVMLKRIYNFSVQTFLSKVIWPVTKVSLLVWAMAKVIAHVIPTASIFTLLVAVILLMFSTVLVVLVAGVSARERQQLFVLIRNTTRNKAN